MTPETRSLLAAVLALPDAERALLVEELLEVLPPPADELTDDQLEAELERRFEDYQRDPSSAIPWSQIKRSRSIR